MSTPKKGEYKRVTAKTPGKTLKKLSFKIGGIGFFLPITPNQPIPHKPRTEDKQKYLCTQKESLCFTVTLDKINKRKGKRKSALSQKSFTKASAQEIFNYHGLDFSLLSGQKHLQHIVGFILGGNHDSTNLFAGTAKSNYAIRDKIEMYMVSKLSRGETDEMHLNIELGYEGDVDIPSVLNYQINWQEMHNSQQRHFKEIFAIYPLSNTPFDHKQKAVLDNVRKLSFESQTDL